MDPSEVQNPAALQKEEKDKWNNLKAGVFLSTVTGFSVLTGFAMTLGWAKKSDPDSFAKGAASSRGVHETGVILATKCLARATVYTVSGFGLLCFAGWKLIGAKNHDEFRLKMGNMLPRLSRTENSGGRTEFATIRDLLQYIIDEDEKEKRLKKAEKKQILTGSNS